MGFADAVCSRARQITVLASVACLVLYVFDAVPGLNLGLSAPPRVDFVLTFDAVRGHSVGSRVQTLPIHAQDAASNAVAPLEVGNAHTIGAGRTPASAVNADNGGEGLSLDLCSTHTLMNGLSTKDLRCVSMCAS